MNKVKLLPKWILPDTIPSVYDTTSGSWVEMASKLYGAMRTLQTEYNSYVDEINNAIEGFINSENQDQAEFECKINKIMHDYIMKIDNKIKVQDLEIANAVDYMKKNITETSNQVIRELIENGEINHDTHFNSVEEMKNSTILIPGDVVKTLGYYAVNDGGSATYKIRTKLDTDIEDNGSIHFLNNGLVAELIIEDKVNILNFGYTIESITYDSRTSNVKNITNALKNAIAYLVRTEEAKGSSGGTTGLQIYFPDDFYYIDEEIDLDEYSISLLGNSPALKGVDYRLGNYRQKIITNVDGDVFSNGSLYLTGLNFYNIHEPSTNDIVFSSAHTRDIKNCVINNYDIVINTNINTVTTINGNYFLNCRKYFIKGNIVDCIITNNYINAERESGKITYCISAGLLSMTTIFNNFIDFFTFTIEGKTQCQGIRILNNTIDYTYRGIKIGGVESGIISNNTFNHISKSYNGTMLHYDDSSEYANNDWYAIETLYTIKSLVINANSIENFDRFLNIPHIELDDSIIASNNIMDNYTKYGSFYKQSQSKKVKFYDLDNKEYLVEPTYNNTYDNQKILYNGVYYRNIKNDIFAIGLEDYEKQTNLSYTTSGEGNFSIDLSTVPNGGLFNNMILEIKTTKNYYSLKTALYKIFRIGGVAYALPLVDNTESDFKPTITNTGTTLNITMSGTYEEGTSSKQVSYRVYEQ